MVGCHNDVEKPVAQQRVTVDTPRGRVMLQDAIHDVAGKTVTASVVGDNINATFRLASISNDAHVVGGRAELIDPSGRLLFAVETTENRLTGEVTMTEATEDDYLAFSISGDDERVYEQYDMNGDVATFDYPALSDEAQRRAVNYHQHGLPVSRLPGDVSEYVANLAGFESYYGPHANTTLENNPYGQLLIQILTSPQLPSLVISDDEDPHIIKWIQQTCTMARTCMALVCRVNPASLVCELCSAVSIACTIVELICSWFGC
jgi:hypothetical protein